MSISIQIRDSDLKRRHPKLANHLWSESFAVVEADNGAIDYDGPTLTSAGADFSSVSAGDYCIIIGYDEVFKVVSVAGTVLTLDKDIGTADATAQSFQVGGYADVIGEAWNILEDDIEDRGLDVDDISATRTFRAAQLYKTLALLFADLFNEPGDKWHTLMEHYDSMYLNELTSTKLEDDGDPDEDIGFYLGTRIQL